MKATKTVLRWLGVGFALYVAGAMFVRFVSETLLASYVLATLPHTGDLYEGALGRIAHSGVVLACVLCGAIWDARKRSRRGSGPPSRILQRGRRTQ